mgnify:CR=1 FL=1
MLRQRWTTIQTMIFQAIDDKSECIGIYGDGKLYFEDFPSELTHTWKHTGSLKDMQPYYAYLFCEGQPLDVVCPSQLLPKLEKAQRRLKAYLKSFQLAKVDMREHCIFDLVPQDFLKEFCEIKNQITQHVFDTHEKPSYYDHLDAVHRLLHKIGQQNLHLTNEGCRPLYYSSINAARANKLLKGPGHIDYNLFGTVTGRLTTTQNSFPMLTLQKDFRQLVKPHNEWFLSLDYNGAEVRTFIALAGEEQPQEDVHQWHIKNLIQEELSREDAKIQFFAWLYNYRSDNADFESYHRTQVLDQWYDGEYIHTPFKRKIRVDKPKALNYLIQSTTADLVLDRAVVLDRFLEEHRSFISHIVHDEIVIDLADDERHLVPEIKELFAMNKLDTFLVNLMCGPNYLELKELKL